MICYKNSGYITLISTLVVGAVGLSIVTAVILLGLGSSRSSFAIQQSVQAKSLANACAEEGLEKIRESTSFSGTGNLSYTTGNCTYTVSSTGGQGRNILAQGNSGDSIRKVQVTIDSITPLINLTSWQEIP